VLYERPIHPYTEALLSAIPVIETEEGGAPPSDFGNGRFAACHHPLNGATPLVNPAPRAHADEGAT
jgi:hypothetical protein